MRFAGVAVAALVSIAAANAVAGEVADRDAERLALYRSHAGEPVDSIRWIGRYSGWTPLDDNAFALWIGSNKAYLLEVDRPCNDLEFATAIRFDRSMGQLHARFDSVQFLRAHSMSTACRIREIRPLDVKAVRQAEREWKARRAASR
jgi:hypothetical protein